MEGINISERTVKIFVIISSVAGLLILLGISYVSDIEEVKLSEIEDHSGDRVYTKGFIIGHSENEGGGASFLICEDGKMVEAFVEDMDEEIPTNCKVRIKCEVFSSDGSTRLTLNSEKDIEILEDMEPVLPGNLTPINSFISMNGTVIDIQYSGWNSIDVTIFRSYGGTQNYSDIKLINMHSKIKRGDLVTINGFLNENSEIIAYGDDAWELDFRPGSKTVMLDELLSEVSESPGITPGSIYNIEGYVKYEPLSTTIYLSDEPQGSPVSIKVLMDEPDPRIHKGDLIEIENSTILWDGEGLRYYFSCEFVSILEPYGPWNLNLDNLPYGISEYENAQVTLSGEVLKNEDRYYLQSGGSIIELRSDNAIPMGGERTFTGPVKYDIKRSSHFLEVLEEIQ